jgi:hypothetical protein
LSNADRLIQVDFDGRALIYATAIRYYFPAGYHDTGFLNLRKMGIEQGWTPWKDGGNAGIRGANLARGTLDLDRRKKQ